MPAASAPNVWAGALSLSEERFSAVVV